MISWRTQRGAASLAVTLLLLFSVTLAVFFANRSLIFEQKTSANQLRATVAFEAAEAGLEWAIAQINDPPVLQAAPSCAPATSNFSTSGPCTRRARSFPRPIPALPAASLRTAR